MYPEILPIIASAYVRRINYKKKDIKILVIIKKTSYRFRWKPFNVQCDNNIESQIK